MGCSQAFVVVVTLFLACARVGGSPTPTPPPLTLKIVLTKPEFFEGEPIWGLFELRNVSSDTVRIPPLGFNSGWLVGAGIEWAFAPNWSAKVEYNYLGLDDRTFIVPAGVPGFLPGDTFTQSDRNIQMVKVGINYLFNWSSYRY